MSGSLAVEERSVEDLTAPERFAREVVEPCRPLVLRDLVRNWPVVKAGARSAQALQEYLSPFDTGAPVEVFIGAPAIAGKYFYAEDLSGFNFERRRMSLSQALELMVSSRSRADAPSGYVGSVSTEDFLPGFAAANPMPLLGPGVAPRIWLGHAAEVSCHHDTFDNLACVVAGARRFTLFSPELIGNLYVGPIDNTIAGPPVSLAASAPAHDDRFPLFRQIESQSLTAELRAGDALYLPKLWWHRVESTAAFNALVNYWWDAFGCGPDAPYTAMLLSMIAIAERPLPERQAWKAFFDHYVFRSNGHPLAHLRQDQHGVLGPLQPDNYRRIRARVMRLLRGD
jgi:Cupin-like domain